MPDKNANPVDINELLAASGASGIQSHPPSEVKTDKATPEPAKDGYIGSFQDGSGRFMHSYLIDGRKVILPKKQEDMKDEDWMSLSSALYDPVSNRVPLNLTVKFRDPQWAGHWANRKAQDGKSIRRLQSLGFLTATKEDCEWVPQGLNTEDGGIVDGDLVLMKIHKMKLFMGFLKGYFDEAMQKGGKAGYKQTAEGAIGATHQVSHYMAAQTNSEFTGLGPIGQPLAR